MENYKTIKELADELGFSKAYIDKTIRILSMHTELSKLGNKYVITRQQENTIKQAIAEKKSHTETHTGMHTESNTESEVFFLRNQMEKKTLELERMQKLLDQQQQLTLQANKQIEQLQSQLFLSADEGIKEETVTREDTEKKISEQEEPLKKWWQFWI